MIFLVAGVNNERCFLDMQLKFQSKKLASKSMKLVNSTNNEVLLKGKQNFIIATLNIQTLEKPSFDALVILV